MAAVVGYLRVVMAQQFNVTPTNQGVWSDAASANTYPYAVIQAPSEQYSRSSNDPETGSMNMYIANGILNIVIYAYDSSLAYSLARQVVGVMDSGQSDGQLNSAMGVVIDVVPLNCAALPPVDESGPVGPTVYRRVVSFQFAQEFYL